MMPGAAGTIAHYSIRHAHATKRSQPHLTIANSSRAQRDAPSAMHGRSREPDTRTARRESLHGKVDEAGSRRARVAACAETCSVGHGPTRERQHRVGGFARLMSRAFLCEAN